MNLRKRSRSVLVTLAAAVLIVPGCATREPGNASLPNKIEPRTASPTDGPPDQPLDPAQIQDARPRSEPLSKYGNPPFYDVFGIRYFTASERFPYRTQGVASWYGKKFHGLRTSSGEPYDMFAMTAAHRSLPLPTYARVTNLDNGISTIVKINDRGPFHSDRIIDLSYAAAVKLGIAANGTGRVEIETIDPDQPVASSREFAPPPRPAAPVASPVNPAPRETQVFVQLGAFSDKRNAESLQQQVQTMHKKVHIADLPLAQGGVLYRVRVGPLADANELARLHSEIVRLGLRPFVVYEARMAN